MQCASVMGSLSVNLADRAASPIETESKIVTTMPSIVHVSSCTSTSAIKLSSHRASNLTGCTRGTEPKCEVDNQLAIARIDRHVAVQVSNVHVGQQATPLSRLCSTMSRPKPSSAPPSEPLASAGGVVAEPAEEEMTEAKVVVIVSCGINTDVGKRWLDQAEKHGFAVFDLRTQLTKDPYHHVQHQQDGKHHDTQVCVFSQDGFSEVMRMLLDEVWRNGQITLHCSKGLHRANVTARMLESLLNSVVNARGERLFNAKHFPLCDVRWHEFDSVIEDARKWWFEPWCEMTKPEVVFGKAAATENPRAMANWRSAVEVIEGWTEYPSEAAKAGPMPPDHPHPGVYDAAGASASASAAAGPMPPDLPPPPPKKARWDDATPSIAAAEPHDDEAWVTFDRDPKAWNQFLARHNVDIVARQELFLLATHSDHGWRAANSLLAKLAKKKSDGANPPNVCTRICGYDQRGVGGWVGWRRL